MKIAVISASGKAGREIFDEASKRGHDVTAIIRDSKKRLMLLVSRSLLKIYLTWTMLI